ncbi:MAG: type II toxin-antitoxin system RelE/ParE family toxin [bacterium]|nr:type II toxin-antitoxin system RelE/ParE family toxin [bacterium]
MLAINLSTVSERYIKKLPPKHKRQITEKIFKLAENPCPSDSSQLHGYKEYCRADIGEHRIIYRFSETVLFVTLVGKRNDDEVYRKLGRLLR